MTVRLLDTLTGAQHDLEALEPGHVRSTAAVRPSTARPTSATSGRSCSPTCSCVTALRAATGDWVMNVTDIDDKIIRRAAGGATIDALTEPLNRWFLRTREAADDRARRPAPGDPPHRRDRALARPCSPRAMPIEGRGLGLLPHRLVSGLRQALRARTGPAAGRRRVDADEYEKEDVHDFALWKGQKPGEPSWTTPSARAGRAGTSSARR